MKDGQNNSPENKDGDAFEEALGFRFWDGECASCEDPSDDGTTGVPVPRSAASPVAREEKTAQESAGESEGKPMTLMGHLGELRSRLMRILIMVMLGFFACYAVSDTLFGELVKPLTASMPQGSKLIFTSIPEAFFVYMKVGFVASLFLTSPYIFYQIWAFVAPGLYEEERRYIIPLAAFSAFFFLSGAAFCYFLVFPIAFEFFMSFATDTILPMPSLNEYLGFALKLLIAFGIIFEMPLFAFFLARIGILTAAHLRRWRKYAIIIIFIVAAILTPPDVVSQLHKRRYPDAHFVQHKHWSGHEQLRDDVGRSEDGGDNENNDDGVPSPAAQVGCGQNSYAGKKKGE
jgi:sec-independent protein translocase protein TatC